MRSKALRGYCPSASKAASALVLTTTKCSRRPASSKATRTGSVMDAPSVRRAATSVGGQLDLRLSMLSALDLTLSVGGAVVVEPGQAPGKEAMISLKILR